MRKRLKRRRFNSMKEMIQADSAGYEISVQEFADYVRRQLVKRKLVPPATLKKQRPKRRSKKGGLV